MSRANIFSFFLIAGLLAPVAAAAGPIYRHVDADGRVVFTDVRPPGEHQIFRKPTAAAARARGWAARAVSLEDRPYHAEIVRASHESGLDPALVHAVVTVESNYNAHAVSRAGALGLMQLMPGTAQRFGVTRTRDARDNLAGGARYLRELLTMFDGDLRLALAAYNAGEEAVMRFGMQIPPYRETRAYVPKVISVYRMLRRQPTRLAAADGEIDALR